MKTESAKERMEISQITSRKQNTQQQAQIHSVHSSFWPAYKANIIYYKSTGATLKTGFRELFASKPGKLTGADSFCLLITIMKKHHNCGYVVLHTPRWHHV
jgi:hypothetical protein